MINTLFNKFVSNPATKEKLELLKQTNGLARNLTAVDVERLKREMEYFEHLKHLELLKLRQIEFDGRTIDLLNEMLINLLI